MYTTQITAVERIREYLEKLNMIPLGFRYLKGKQIEVKTTEGLMTFQFGREFKRVK